NPFSSLRSKTGRSPPMACEWLRLRRWAIAAPRWIWIDRPAANPTVARTSRPHSPWRPSPASTQGKLREFALERGLEGQDDILFGHSNRAVLSIGAKPPTRDRRGSDTRVSCPL